MIKPNLKQKIKNTVNANRIISMEYVEKCLVKYRKKHPKKSNHNKTKRWTSNENLGVCLSCSDGAKQIVIDGEATKE